MVAFLFLPVLSGALAPEVENIGSVVNSSESDFSPVVSPDGNKLFFTSTREGGHGGQDIWVSERVDGKWTEPENLGPTVNDARNQGPDCFYRDEETGEEYLFLTYCHSKEEGLCDLYKTKKREDGSWGEPEPLGAPVNTKYSEANANFDYINKVLFFASTRPGGIEGPGSKKFPDESSYDIWMSPLKDDGSWGEPLNLGRPVNTSQWEGVAIYHAADNTLYFSSSGHGAEGGADIFRSKRLGPNEWAEPEPVDAVNSSGNDIYFSIPASGDLAYFSSTFPGGEGMEDIYVVPLSIILSPETLAKRTMIMPKGEKAAGISAGHVETVYFNFDKHNIKSSEKEKLDKAVGFIEDHPYIKIELAGHADSVGKLDYNMVLSAKRAEAVRGYLVERGVDPKRLEMRFYGETKPAEPNDPQTGNPLNRRVEISILD
ncbi:MAG: OmpA family protein [bacterium]